MSVPYLPVVSDLLNPKCHLCLISGMIEVRTRDQNITDLLEPLFLYFFFTKKQEFLVSFLKRIVIIMPSAMGYIYAMASCYWDCIGKCLSLVVMALYTATRHRIVGKLWEGRIGVASISPKNRLSCPASCGTFISLNKELAAQLQSHEPRRCGVSCYELRQTWQFYPAMNWLHSKVVWTLSTW